jgi:hypothetical protein
MAIHYICRHCRSLFGSIEHNYVSEAQLGLHSLTPQERNDIIAYSSNGDMIVNVACDYCSEALQSNPELLLLASPLQ